MANNRDNKRTSVLVTGGAGYIGSHVVKHLMEEGENVIVLDDLSNGSLEAVENVDFHQGSINDRSLVMALLNTRRVNAILHFAAFAIVSESVDDPAKYYRNNTGGTANLLYCASRSGVKHFVFSSTAAVYGVPESGICTESSETKPINPYGQSKLYSEGMLRDVCNSLPMTHAILRYFNVAGADPSGRLGQRGKVSTHLTKIACEVATGKREQMDIYGTDYETRDGTCIRDYIHVEDLASAHVSALDYLRKGSESVTLNCGYGRGFSVREIIRSVEQASDKKLAVKEAARRQGDPPVLVADATRIGRTLDWSPKYDDLDCIAKTSFDWEKSLAQRS